MKDFGTAVILAGGKSTRMGENKELLSINNRRLVDMQISKLRTLFDEVIVITNNPMYYEKSKCKTYKDVVKDKGPIGGIYSGLINSSSRYTYFLACDMPVINKEYINYMKKLIKKDYKKACITLLGQWIEPFNAFYSKDLIPEFKNYIEKGGLSVHKLVKNTNCLFIEEKKAREFSSKWDMFINFNTKEDLESFNLEKRLNYD
jgi:molybdopterin-guanine dinucleotide biosynthesis protein A